tara:strand:+ start:280 stop:477 length:198 start_codon:yes stop_codon:yes gene_type:complete
MFSDDINLFEDISHSYLNMEKDKKNKMVKVIENTKDLIKLLEASYTSYEIQEKVKILKELLYKID